MSKISVVIPVYNVEKYLKRCLDSVVVQTFVDLDIVLVDDGSTDASPAICDEYSETDSRIVVIHQSNKGLSGARNTGINWAVAHNPDGWISFIDSDDWVNEPYFELLFKSAEVNGCLISACSFVRTGNDAPAVVTQKNDKIFTTEEFYNQYFFEAQSAVCKLFHMSLFSNIRFREGIIYEDSALVYRILFSQTSIAFSGKGFYFYYRNPDSITGSSWDPKKMVYCEVMNDQLAWLTSNGFKSCAKTCLIHALQSIHYQENLIHDDPKYKRYARELRLFSRQLLNKYAKEYGISLRNNPQLYETGFPVLTNYYWFIQTQLKKIK